MTNITNKYKPLKTNTKAFIIGLGLFSLSTLSAFAQTAQTNASTPPPTKAQQEIIDLSKQKWQWMADKNVDKLAGLFDDKAKFVHMSGTWKKDEELDIIKTGSIWYKNADVHDTAVELFDNNTAIIWIGSPKRSHYAGGYGTGHRGKDGVYRYRSL